MVTGLKIVNDFLRFRGEDKFEKLDFILTYRMVTTIDKVYYTHFLILARKLEQATSLLEATVEQEGDFSTSMVIWPKELFENRLIYLFIYLLHFYCAVSNMYKISFDGAHT